jgi:transcriptional regulator
MYVPRHFAADDAIVRALLERPGLAELVTATPSRPLVTPFPALFDPSPGDHGAILGHLARGNDHWRQEVVGEALVVVRGPDSYVTPSWYASKAEHGRVVPTWNYVTLHAYGDLVVHDDPDWLADQVRRLTDQHEHARQQPWSVDDAPAGFVDRQLRAIVGIELRVRRLEGKAKLSQNRDEADASGVVTGLRAEGDEVMAQAVTDARRP